MYNLFVSTLLAASALSLNPSASETPPTITSFHTSENVEVMHLEYEKKGSEVYISLLLQVDGTVLSVTSASYNYVEATEQLNQVIAAATNK